MKKVLTRCFLFLIYSNIGSSEFNINQQLMSLQYDNQTLNATLTKLIHEQDNINAQLMSCIQQIIIVNNDLLRNDVDYNTRINTIQNNIHNLNSNYQNIINMVKAIESSLNEHSEKVEELLKNNPSPEISQLKNDIVSIQKEIQTLWATLNSTNYFTNLD